jgi:hypothetical protein
MSHYLELALRAGGFYHRHGIRDRRRNRADRLTGP